LKRLKQITIVFVAVGGRKKAGGFAERFRIPVKRQTYQTLPRKNSANPGKQLFCNL